MNCIAVENMKLAPFIIWTVVAGGVQAMLDQLMAGNVGKAQTGGDRTRGAESVQCHQLWKGIGTQIIETNIVDLLNNDNVSGRHFYEHC